MGDRAQFDLVVIGLGPAGIASVLSASQANPALRILAIDSGRDFRRRPCPVDGGRACRGCGGICNVIGGFGGSMHYGDGIKLSLLPSGRRLLDLFGEAIAMDLCLESLELLAPDVAPDEFAGGQLRAASRAAFASAGLHVREYPVAVVGEARLSGMIERLHGKVHAAAQVRLLTELRSIKATSDESGFSLNLAHDGVESNVTTRTVILATGRKGLRVTQDVLSTFDVRTTPPQPSIGVRLEMAASHVARAGHEHPDLKITQRHDGCKVKTFCFCGGSNGGRIKFTRYTDAFAQPVILLDGHATTDRPAVLRELAGNFGLMVQLGDTSSVERIMDRYIELSGGRPMAQTMDDFFAARKPMYSWPQLSLRLPFEPSVADLQVGPLYSLFDDRVMGALRASADRVLDGVSTVGGKERPHPRDVLVVGPELEFFWDEVALTNTCETDQAGLYVVGDAAGLAQGVIQAGMMGMAAGRVAAQRTGDAS